MKKKTKKQEQNPERKLVEYHNKKVKSAIMAPGTILPGLP